MQTMPSRSILFLFGTFWLLVILNSAEAQVIRFTLALPPSFEIIDQGEAPLILEPITGNQNIRGKEGIRWIEIRSTENVELIIQMHPDRRIGGAISASRTYFLNDGTYNFDSAEEIPIGGATMRMHNGYQTINEMKDKPNYLSAWLGLPARQSGLLTIIYL